MAGAGYKLFNTGDVLTAAQVNTYLNEQTVMVFANSTARTTALSGVLAEGMVSYLQDTNAVEVYNGSAWVGVSGAGDVTEVQAGTGISVASGTGPIPVVTNTMATAVDAKGDLIVGTGADTFARLAVGTNGHTLVAKSSEATGLAWEAPAAVSGPAFSAFRATSQQNFSASTHTKVELNSENFDTDNCFDSTTNFRFTPNKAGKYQFNATVYFQASTTGRAIFQIYKNGSAAMRLKDDTVALAANVYSGSALMDMNGTTDYVELYVWNAGTSPFLDFFASGTGTVFSGTWIRS